MATAITDQLTHAAPPDAAINVTEKTACLMLTFGAIGVERKVKADKIHERGNPEETAPDDSPVEVEADKKLLRVSKKLIVSEELDAVQSNRRAFVKWLRELAVPSFLKEGVYLIPVKAIEKVAARLEEMRAKDNELVKDFVAVYKQRADETKSRLRELGETADYPTVQKVRAAFTCEWQWVSFSTPAKLREVSEGFFEQEKSRAEARFAQATEEITLMMRAQLQGLVAHLVEVLDPTEDGKRKRFHASTVTKIKEFLDNFSIRNVTDDEQLEVIVKSAKQLLDGVDADDLRTNEAVRDQTAEGFDLVKTCLDKLVEQAGSRKIELED